MKKVRDKDCYWVTCPSSDFEGDKGIPKEIVVRVEEDSNPKYREKYCIVRTKYGVLRVKGSPEEVAEKFWKSRALPDGKGGFYKNITPRKARN